MVAGEQPRERDEKRQNFKGEKERKKNHLIKFHLKKCFCKHTHTQRDACG
jgi:hypothetical protein